MKYTAREVVEVLGSTYKIIDDYGDVYVTRGERPCGGQTWHVKKASPVYGKDALLGDDPLGEIFPYFLLFGIPLFWGSVVYSHRDSSWWKRFLNPSIFYRVSPERAREIVNAAAWKLTKGKPGELVEGER